VPRRIWIVLLLLALLALFPAEAALAPGLTAAATSRPGHPKRGIASSRYESSRPALLKQLGASWAYDWSATPPRAGGPEWVPIIWGAGSIGATQSLAAQHRHGRIRYLLGFNEPDSHTQANMTPTQAAALWPRLEKTGLILGSPASQVPSDGWLQRFMALVEQRHLFAMLDGLRFVQRYAWFTDDCWNDLGCRYGSLLDGRSRPTPAARSFRTSP
jgi:hypothetical protein